MLLFLESLYLKMLYCIISTNIYKSYTERLNAILIEFCRLI